MKIDQELDGRSCARIDFPPDANDDSSWISASETKTLVYRERYFGDHTESWVIVNEGEHETSRHNARFLVSILWQS